jgi:hypothetical protein
MKCRTISRDKRASASVLITAGFSRRFSRLHFR